MSQNKRGYVIPVGGAEEKIEKPVILKRIVKICGGRDARIVIIPTASMLPSTGSKYEKLFDKLGSRSAVSLQIEKRSDCSNKEFLNHIRNATGIFITGGNQLRLSTIIGGTELSDLIRQKNLEGTHVAGTSAGAAIMPEHMIAGGESGPTPNEGGVTLAPGIGLTRNLIIDQHFSQRGRLGRLLTAISYNPRLIGVGIDENTAIFIDADNIFEVVGNGAVTIVDGSKLEHSTAHAVRPSQSISLIGVQMHILSDSGIYNTETREAFLGPDQTEV